MSKSKKPIRKSDAAKQGKIFKQSIRRADSPYLDEYLPADTEVVFHEGLEGLDVIRIQLPKPPNIKRIEGYNLPAKEQKFRLTKVPPKLARLNEKAYVDVEDFWKEIVMDFDYYKDDFWFIEQEWNRRRFGHWVFIKGKPTWIPPWHYMQLNYQEFVNEQTGGNRMEYRDRDRKLYVGRWYAATTTESPFKYKCIKDDKVKFTSSDKYIMELEDKGWKIERKGYMVDMGARVCIGTVEFKSRRSGYTYQCSNIGTEIVTRMSKGLFGLQSMTEDNAERIFQKQITQAYKGMPFFFRPVSENIVDPKRTIKFMPSGKKSSIAKGARAVKALYSEITYGSSSVGYFDSQKLKYYLGDEFGKTKEVDVLERALVARKTLSTGDNKIISGYSNHISTAGDLKTGGGSSAKKLAQLSHWGQRSDIGQTDTGYINLFIPADEGLEGFIDEWGGSKKEEAREWILSKRRSFIEKEAWEQLNEEIRQTPLEWKENFISNNKQARFNVYILEKRVSDLTVGTNNFVFHGKFAWEKSPAHNYMIRKLPTRQDFISQKDRIIFIPQPSYDFDWELSYMPDPKDQNKIIFDERENKIIPANHTKFGHGIDPFKYGEKTSSGSGSFGGGAIFRNYDPLVDLPHLNPMGINPKTGDYNHVTNRFCGVYLRRPSLEEFLEQQLMAALFFGMKSYPEMNLPEYHRWVKDRGFDEYLFYDVDEFTGDEKKKPGAHTNATIINTIFNAWAQHIDQNGMREVHPVLLQQCLEIDDKMSDYDAFTAGGYALMQSAATNRIEIEVEDTFDASTIFEFESL